MRPSEFVRTLVLCGLIAVLAGCGPSIPSTVQIPIGGAGGINLTPPAPGGQGGNGTLAGIPTAAATGETIPPPPPPPNTTAAPSTPPPAGGQPAAPGTPLVPPRGSSSGGTGGQAGLNGVAQSVAGANYYLFVPDNYAGAPTPFLLVFTGVEGANGQSALGLTLPGDCTFLQLWGLGNLGLGNFIIAIIDTPTYFQQGVKDAALAPVGAAAMDDVRARYNIDNDRMCLLGESMGTKAGEAMGFHLRQSYFAAYYLNDVVAIDAPAQTAAQIGFAPFSQVGPGGAYNTANALVTNLRAAGYQLPQVAPDNGAGSDLHGSPAGVQRAYMFFNGKSRQ